MKLFPEGATDILINMNGPFFKNVSPWIRKIYELPYCTRCDGLRRTSPNAARRARCGETGYEPK